MKKARTRVPLMATKMPSVADVWYASRSKRELRGDVDSVDANRTVEPHVFKRGVRKAAELAS